MGSQKTIIGIKSNHRLHSRIIVEKQSDTGIKHNQILSGPIVIIKHIMKTCPCNKLRFFSPVNIENFIGFLNIFFLFLLKT